MIMAGTGVAMLPRGVRNNNPGNIRGGRDQWRGKIGEDEKGFVIFDTKENGIRAMARLLKNYRASGTDTIREIINRWAPSSENNTTAYIASVAKRAGIGADEYVTDAVLPRVLAAMIHHENGQQPYTMAAISAGVNAA